MVDYREILRLKSLGYSRNQIEASAHISHHTVKAVLDTAESLGICWPLDEKLTKEKRWTDEEPLSGDGRSSLPPAAAGPPLLSVPLLAQVFVPIFP